VSLILLAGSFAADLPLALGSVGLLILAWPLFRWTRPPRTLFLGDGVPEAEP
jgi:hypothetical protein